MTKVTILGEEPQETKKKPIEFVKILNSGLEIKNINPRIDSPKKFSNIELICRNYAQGLDLMFAYDRDRNDREAVLYLGHFNDGVV